MSMALPILQEGVARPVYAQGPRSLDAVKLLRISVTDRCNLRCVYCMPLGGVAFEDQRDLLSADELVAVAAAARSVGVDHFKVTGGEPTVRKDVVDIVAGLKKLQPRDLSLTTNGMLLDRLAQPLRDAGLDRLTISWDSMKADRFDRITRGRLAPISTSPAAALKHDDNAAARAPEVDAGDDTGGDIGQHSGGDTGRNTGGGGDASALLDRLHLGLDAARRAGFVKIKINVVVIGGINDDEVVDFARLSLDEPMTVRFIEYMPLGDSVLIDDAEGYLVDNAVVRQRIESALGPLSPVTPGRETGVGPAQVFELPHAKGRVGFISAMSQPFCESCNRLRLTATGELRSCLFDGGEVDIVDALRPTPDPQRIIDLMRRCVAMKPDVHSNRGNRAMSQMGG